MENGRANEETRQIGVLGSPNTLERYIMDVVDSSFEESLYGKLLKFRHQETVDENRKEFIVFSQVAEMENRNVWHEQIGMRSLLKKKGVLTHLSGDADLKQCVLSYLGSYDCESDDEWKPSNIGTPPRSGTQVHFVTQDDIIKATTHLVPDPWYMGFVPGTKLKVPFAIKHFGTYQEGGTGEARMYGIFGQSGSGKSIIAAEIIAGFARHDDMGILIIDPQGEFFEDKFGEGTSFKFEFQELLKNVNSKKEITKRRINYIKLDDDAELFIQLVNSRGILKGCGIGTGEKISDCSEFLISKFKSKMSGSREYFSTLKYSEFCDLVWEAVKKTYSGKQKEFEVKDKLKENTTLKDKFDECVEFFKPRDRDGRQKLTLRDLISKFLSGQIVIISMISENEMLYEDKAMIINQIVDKIIKEAEIRYNSQQQRRINGIIVLDEAHRYAQQKMEGEEIPEAIIILRKKLERATKETRKYSLGWLFITQSIVGFSKDIYRQLTDIWYGFGLTVGADADYVASRVGKDAFGLYAHFPNPKQTGKYNFLVYGSCVALGTMGKPIAIEAFNYEEFLEANGLDTP